jgi:hypothetical protein
MILERRSIPCHPIRPPPPSPRSILYPLNRFSDIIELARLNEAWLLRRVSGGTGGERRPEGSADRSDTPMLPFVDRSVLGAVTPPIFIGPRGANERKRSRGKRDPSNLHRPHGTLCMENNVDFLLCTLKRGVPASFVTDG